MSLYFNQMIGGNGQEVTLEISKQFVTSSEIPLYHPDDVNQEFPGGIAYIAMPEFPSSGPIVPEPSTWRNGLVAVRLADGVSGARRRCRRRECVLESVDGMPEVLGPRDKRCRGAFFISWNQTSQSGTGWCLPNRSKRYRFDRETISIAGEMRSRLSCLAFENDTHVFCVAKAGS